MKTKKEKFLAELSKRNTTKKVSLKSNKIALSLVSEIESEYSWLEQSYSEASYGIEFMEEWLDKIMDFNTELSIAVDNYVVNGAAYSLEEAAANMRVRIEDLEAAAADIGISPDNLVSNYQEIKDILRDADAIDSEFVDAYKNVLNEANDRFGLANFS
jgi:hypothetical protein|tara:strand:+ start:899 stop:1372 length:474 start_codon:yes stop_codon:yes gene_type:complete